MIDEIMLEMRHVLWSWDRAQETGPLSAAQRVRPELDSLFHRLRRYFEPPAAGRRATHVDRARSYLGEAKARVRNPHGSAPPALEAVSALADQVEELGRTVSKLAWGNVLPYCTTEDLRRKMESRLDEAYRYYVNTYRPVYKIDLGDLLTPTPLDQTLKDLVEKSNKVVADAIKGQAVKTKEPTPEAVRLSWENNCASQLNRALDGGRVAVDDSAWGKALKRVQGREEAKVNTFRTFGYSTHLNNPTVQSITTRIRAALKVGAQTIDGAMLEDAVAEAYSAGSAAGADRTSRGSKPRY